MGKRISLVAAIALLLTGCGSATAAVPSPEDKDAQYVSQVRPLLHEYSAMPDERIVELAPEFCEQAADGYSLADMREAASKFNSDAQVEELVRMGEAALNVYCPEYAE